MLYLITRYVDKFRHWQASFNWGLRFKLVLLIAIVSFFSVLASSALILTLQKQQLEDSAMQSTTRLSDAINASLEQAMLRDDRPMIRQIVQTLVDKQNVEHIRILDRQGIVHISSQPTEVGVRFDYSQALCQFCHTDGTRPSNQTTMTEMSDGRTALLNVTMIYNQPQCQSCHDAQRRILGLTMIEVPLGDLNNQVASGFWRIVLSSLVSLALLIVLMIIALRKLIIKPIDELTRGMTEIRAGNLDCALQVSTRDEFGKLADTFDDMRRQLKSSRSENVELYKRVRSLAILEERDRLAREMHDNLAQMLGYINFKLAVTDELLAKPELAQARANLIEIKRVAKEAFTDVREAIFNLRQTAPIGDGLISMLRGYLDEYQAHYGIETDFWIEDLRLAEFPEEVQLQINRIVQEALTNVRKHARASRVSVRIEHVDHHVQIGIGDNGTGFDAIKLSQDGVQHYGLQIMRERAASVGGDLEINSQPGAGTRILLRVPLYPVFEDPHENIARSISG
jgi:signal transduction histidine kinase